MFIIEGFGFCIICRWTHIVHIKWVWLSPSPLLPRDFCFCTVQRWRFLQSLYAYGICTYWDHCVFDNMVYITLSSIAPNFCYVQSIIIVLIISMLHDVLKSHVKKYDIANYTISCSAWSQKVISLVILPTILSLFLPNCKHNIYMVQWPDNLLFNNTMKMKI